MKRSVLLVAISLLCSVGIYAQKELVKISGKVKDFEENLVANATVQLMNEKFDPVEGCVTKSDENGNYELNVPKGTYYCMFSMILEEYPKFSPDLPKEDQRLEFWGWNIIAEKDIEIDIHYDRMEVYALNVFQVQGSGYPGYNIFCRPMSLSKVQKTNETGGLNMPMCTVPEKMEISVEIDGEKVKLRRVQEVIETAGKQTTRAYLLTVDPPQKKSKENFQMFRVQMKDTENGDQGEGICFLRKQQYIK